MATQRPHVIAALFFAILAVVPTFGQQKPGALKIVVLTGEDAVNVVQQKTAVAPIVEVRDRNNQPVSGAAVTFAIRSGRATLSGSRTLTVTTNAAGRAVASGLTPTGAGALKIGASAAFQGQSAAVTIAQTNVMTAAQAAGAAAAGGATGGTGTTAGAGGAAGGGAGGGVSATTLGIVGGAVAGGVVATQQLVSRGGGTSYSGPFSSDYVRTVGTILNGAICTVLQAIDGTLTIELVQQNGAVSGNATLNVRQSTFLGGTCPGGTPGSLTGLINEVAVSGGGASLSFTEVEGRDVLLDDGNHHILHSYVFTGALEGDVITGTLTFSGRDEASTRVGTWLVPMAVLLQRQNP